MSDTTEQQPGLVEHSEVEGPEADPDRLRVLKTYKLYIGGAFPRTESGRYDRLLDQRGRHLANVCRASRKDFRDAVRAARAAQPGWAARSAYNRGQILYRVGEVLEGRREQLAAELVQQGTSSRAAAREVEAAIDRWVYYAGWADKLQQVFSAVNPVASSHFNFSIVEPTGVVSLVAPAESGLLGLVSTLAPIVVAGNSAVALAASRYPLSAITLAEALEVSDLPAGVVNLLTGRRAELLPHFASHLDVNAIVYCGDSAGEIEAIETEAVHNLKRVVVRRGRDWGSEEAADPYQILDTLEVKTTWHPIGS